MLRYLKATTGQKVALLLMAGAVALLTVTSVMSGCTSSSPTEPGNGADTTAPSQLYMNFVPQYSHEPPGSTPVYVGGKRDRSWSHISQAEGALAVVDSCVRTTTFSPPAGLGHEYTLDGVPTGVTFQCTPSVYDATTDGQYIYAWRWFEAQLVRYSLEWTDPEVLFGLARSSYSKAYMGITFDPTTETIWLSSWSQASFHRLDNYSMAGTLLSSIDIGAGWGAGLAMDYADTTLWFFDRQEERYEQYAIDGTPLGTMTGMTRIYGAEFAPPSDWFSPR